MTGLVSMCSTINHTYSKYFRDIFPCTYFIYYKTPWDIYIYISLYHYIIISLYHYIIISLYHYIISFYVHVVSKKSGRIPSPTCPAPCDVPWYRGLLGPPRRASPRSPAAWQVSKTNSDDSNIRIDTIHIIYTYIVCVRVCVYIYSIL
jgi:hypothetical protein